MNASFRHGTMNIADQQLLAANAGETTGVAIGVAGRAAADKGNLGASHVANFMEDETAIGAVAFAGGGAHDTIDLTFHGLSHPRGLFLGHVGGLVVVLRPGQQTLDIFLRNQGSVADAEHLHALADLVVGAAQQLDATLGKGCFESHGWVFFRRAGIEKDDDDDDQNVRISRDTSVAVCSNEVLSSLTHGGKYDACDSLEGICWEICGGDAMQNCH